jgi:hypothetical protein
LLRPTSARSQRLAQSFPMWHSHSWLCSWGRHSFRFCNRRLFTLSGTKSGGGPILGLYPSLSVIPTEAPRMRRAAEDRGNITSSPQSTETARAHAQRRSLLPYFLTSLLPTSLLQILPQPIQKRPIPQLAILWLQYPMPLIRKNHQLRRHILPLQRIEKFQ